MRSALSALLFGGLLAAAPQADARVLDGFDDPARWRLQVSEGAQARLSRVGGGDGGRAICVHADFGALAGSVRLSAPLPLSLPSDGVLQLSTRGQAAQAQLSLQLVDEQGRRHAAHLPGRELSTRWQPMAWWLSQFHDGSGKGLTLPARSQRLELRLASASGGQVQWCLDSLTLQVRAQDDSPFNPVALADTATALQQRMVDGRNDTLWVSSGRKQQTVSLDLGREREVGGLVVQWAPGLRADAYTVQASRDGRRWQPLRQVRQPSGTTDHLRLGPLEARYLRLDLEQGPNWRYGIIDLLVQSGAYGRSLAAFLRQVGAQWPSGTLPSALTGERQDWTVLGAEHAAAPVWFSEQGSIDPRPGQFTLEPQLQIDGSWHGAGQMALVPQWQAGAAQTRWQHDKAQLDITATSGHDGRGQPWLRVRYRLGNPDAGSHRYALGLALRPFQLHAADRLGDLPGGVGWIEQVAIERDQVRINQQPVLLARQAPDAAFASHFEAGLDLNLLRAAQLPQTRQASDAQGLASAVLLWRAELAAGASQEWEVWLPLFAGSKGVLPTVFNAQPLAGEGWVLPGAQGRELVMAWQAALARMRAERSGPWLRVDSRRQIGAGNRDGMAIANALTMADQIDVVQPWLLARIASGSTRHCGALAHWAQLAAQLQAAGGWELAMLQALQPWLATSMARYQEQGSCMAEPRADDPATVLARLSSLQLAPEPALAAPVQESEQESVDQPLAGAIAATDAGAVVVDPPAGLSAPLSVAMLPPGEPVTLAQRQQRWEAALAQLDDQLLPGWQRWGGGQSRGLLDARQAAEQVRAIAAVIIDEQPEHLRLLPGLPADAWRDGRLQVPALLTRWGRLGLQGRREGDAWVLQFSPGMQLPPGGLVLDWPFAQAPAPARVDGVEQAWHEGRLHLQVLPAELRIELPAN